MGAQIGSADTQNYVTASNVGVTIQTLADSTNSLWVFDLDGYVTMPLHARLNSGGVGNTNSAEFGTVVNTYGDNGVVQNSQIYMSAGTGEARILVNMAGDTLVYYGTEEVSNPNFTGMVAMDPNVRSQYAIALDSNSNIILGGAQPGGTLISSDYIAGLGSLNSDYNLNGVYVDTMRTVVSGINNVQIQTGGGNQWTFGFDGNIVLPGTASILSDNVMTLQSGDTLFLRSDAGGVGIYSGNSQLSTTSDLGIEAYADSINLTPNAQGAVLIDINNTNAFVEISGPVGSWMFTGDGNLTLPAGGTINYSDGSNALIGGTPFNPTNLVQNVNVTSTTGGFSGDGQFTLTYEVNSYATVNSTGMVAQCEGLTIYVEGAASTGSQTVNGDFGGGHGAVPYSAYAFVTTNVGTIWSTVATGTTGLCLVAGTRVTLADGSTKRIEDISYSDQIKVWDFDTASFASARALWIKRSETAMAYNELMFGDGSTLRTVDQHRIFNKQAGAFTYPMTDDTPIGTITYTVDGAEVVLVGKRVVTEIVDYYNVITDGHMNLFANGILTSCRFSNAYPIHSMRWIKAGRTLRDRAEFAGIADRWIDGLRLCEQTYSVEDCRWYVARLERLEIAELALAA